PLVIAIRLEGPGHFARTQFGQTGPLPLLALAAVLGQLDRVESFGQGGEGTACRDLGELTMIANENNFGAGCAGSTEQAPEIARPDHASLVDDNDVAPRQLGPVMQEASQRPRGDASAGRQ